MVERILINPLRSFLLIILVAFSLIVYFLYPGFVLLAEFAAVLGSAPTLYGAFKSLRSFRINIDIFNSFALVISFITHEIGSLGFIVLMLLSADLLDWFTEARASKAIEELLRLKPERALVERNGRFEEIPTDEIKSQDNLLIKEGSRIPVDGKIYFGEAYINESQVTGESVPIKRKAGEEVMSGSLVESGTLKIVATKIGRDSTIERIAELIRDAVKNKSKSERLADRFSAVFLPVVIGIGALTYWISGSLEMTAAIFLVACADDMAVAIPLAITASLGRAAQRGVIIKGGGYLETLAHLDTVVLDKTGTLTYGEFSLKDSGLEEGIEEANFWKTVGSAEKLSDHPISRAVYKELSSKYQLADPDGFQALKGMGLKAKLNDKDILIGNELIAKEFNIDLPQSFLQKFRSSAERFSATASLVIVNGKPWGYFTVGDIPRSEAKESIADLHRLGIKEVIIFTGDNKDTARNIAAQLGVQDVRASMKPEDKLTGIRDLITEKKRTVAMVGDGINDAPVLAGANVGIAMGGRGTAIAVEAADIVILTDNLSRIPEVIRLGRKTTSVINIDMIIWFITNIFGFVLVLTGFAGPAVAAFYNFITDFLPLINSSRLFYAKIKKN